MIGKTLGHYQIVEKLGAGGMGEVYRAEDTNLHRNVAIKVLPDEFAQDAERLSRFQREAQVLASLSHPNIAALHGLEVSDGKRFIVMELVEGQTLAHRLLKGPMPVEEALQVCRQIAEGLEAAHEKGVIHRDLKPGNVMITADDKVKILDFGLAKALTGESKMADATHSPTITEAMTRPGVVLGTAAYMSPEQARGKSVDKRSDIWAFGCILYECLTSKRAFEGETVTETLAAVLTRDPLWDLLPRATPWRIRDLVRRCLERSAAERLRDIGDARIDIRNAGALTPAAELSDLSTMKPLPAWQRPFPLALAAVLVASTGIILGVMLFRDRRPETETRLSRLGLRLPPDVTNSSIFYRYPNSLVAISRDGSHVAFVGGPSDSLYIRALDNLELRRLQSTENARNPFFAPDGKTVAFFTGSGELKTISMVEGSLPQTLCRGIAGSYWAFGSWGGNKRIVFSSSYYSGLFVVSADGGEPVPLTTPKNEAHIRPQWLPGCEAVVFYTQRGDTTLIQTLKFGESPPKPTTLLEDACHPLYLDSGHLLFLRDGKLLAVPFDPVARQTFGSPVSIPLSVAVDAVVANAPVPQFAVSQNGTLVYAPASRRQSEQSELVWVDRNNHVEEIGMIQVGLPHLQLSPDNTRLALEHRVGPEVRISIYDMTRRIMEASLTAKRQEFVGMPVWSRPDGKRIYFSRPRIFDGVVASKSVDGNAPEVELFRTAGSWLFAFSFSDDGKRLAYNVNRNEAGGTYLRVGVYEFSEKPAEGNILSMPEIRAAVSEPALSPNGRWIAYTSDEGDTNQVYLSRYPSGETRRLSPNGGNGALWSRDGKEVFYQRRRGAELWVIPVETRPQLRIGEARKLIEGSYLESSDSGRSYDVSLDGKRFLMVKTDPQDWIVSDLIVVQNWLEELKRLVPVK